MALLAYAPVGYLLLRESRLGLALLGVFGVLLVEPLPDNDFWIPFLAHRGTSHSLFCALVVGTILGGLGWVVGTYLSAPFANVLAGGGLSPVGIFAGVFDWLSVRVRGLAGPALAKFGFAVGVFGILVHLLGDVITVSGIRPLLPLSHRQISLSGLHADSPSANSGLFALGVLAITVVLFMTAPSVGFTATPADLSPVDIAAGQTANQTGPAVEFSNQTSNGSTVVIERATLPEGGFIALHAGGYAVGPAPADASIIAVSEYLPAGQYENVTIEVSNAPPGNYPGLNCSRLNESGTFAATLYRDTNGNQRFDFVRSFGQTDTAY
ncbi:MAG TPA: metal-dependent hydrolase, partial [Halococcus sp.]|nr:metal-dependent hydrolase [Halococcus sp.]